MWKQGLGLLVAGAIMITGCGSRDSTRGQAGGPATHPASDQSGSGRQPDPVAGGPDTGLPATAGDGRSAAPNSDTNALTPLKHRHFTIWLPDGWVVSLNTETGDQVILRNPDTPDLYISVFTWVMSDAGPQQLSGRWQFADRNPQPIQSPSGHPGLMAEGSLSTDPNQAILAVGYAINGRAEQVAQATAPREGFEQARPLFEAILRSFEPHPDTGK